MPKITLLVIGLMLTAWKAQAGLLNAKKFAYNTGYLPPLPVVSENSYNLPCDSTFEGATYDAPLPVAPVANNNDHHGFASFGYATPSFIKIRGNSVGFRLAAVPFYSAVRSHHKFAFPAPANPAIYKAPAPVNFGTHAISYSGFESPNTVIKFGPPITTTTTTSYSTTALGAASGAHHLNAAGGW